MTNGDVDDELREKISDLEDDVEALESRVDTLGECAARADKNRELIESIQATIGQIGFVDFGSSEE